jgi:HEAT repeat protein
VKRNMLYMIGKCSSKEIAHDVRPYVSHENPKVRFQAIRILLNLGDGYAASALRDLLHSKDRDDVTQAVELSGLFRVRETVPDLVLMLRKKAKTGADLNDKIPIVKALGKIGDLRALDAMRGLLASRSLLFKSTLRKLKEEINLALESYPAEDGLDLGKNH